MEGFSKVSFPRGRSFGVRVNAIAAGMFDTEMGRRYPIVSLQMHHLWASAERLGRPEDLAEYGAFMVSDRNSLMNGEVVIVDRAETKIESRLMSHNNAQSC